jgi:hypothetical protein
MLMMKSVQGTTARMFCCCLAAIVLLISGGCSSLKVVETWHKPAAQEHRYKKILILGIARDNTKRVLFENLVVEELRRNQVVAVPGNSVLPVLDIDTATRSTILAAVKSSGCDAVLTTRATLVGDTTVTQDGQSAYVYGANVMASHYDFMKARLQANLYDIATEELVWSSTLTTFDADKEARVSRDLGRLFF